MKHPKRSARFPTQIHTSEYCTIDAKVKRKYPTKLDAELAAPVRDLDQYVCEHCGFWHNGKGRKTQIKQ